MLDEEIGTINRQKEQEEDAEFERDHRVALSAIHNNQ